MSVDAIRRGGAITTNDEFEDFLNEQDALDAAQGGSFNDFTQGTNIVDYLKNLGLLGGLAQGIGGAAAVTSAYNRLGDIGTAAQQGALGIAQQGLEQSQFQPFTVTSTTGGTFGYNPTTGAVTMGLSPEEQAVQSMLLGQGRDILGGPIYGQMLGRQAGRGAFGLGQQFMEEAGMPTAEREAEVYDRMRAAQAPEEERQRLALEERLASQGRLGVRTSMFGGTPEQLAMEKAQAEQRDRAMLAAMGQAQQERALAGSQAQAFTSLGSQLSAQDQALMAAQQQRGLGALGGAYLPQAQLLNVQQAAQLFPQLQQRGQLYGAGLFGEASMGGLEALLGAGLGQANLMGQLGTGLLSGLATPTDSYGGIPSVLGDVGEFLFGEGGLFG